MRIVELAWLAVAAMSTFEVYNAWGNWQRVGLYALFLAVALFMYGFRRTNRIKQQNKEQ